MTRILILECGEVFERTGCGFSPVRGAHRPPSAMRQRPEPAGAPFEAMDVPLVFHSLNPCAPTVHLNVRMLTAQPPGPGVGAVPAPVPARWFGGGMDLTPHYGSEKDARHFRRVCRDALAPLGGHFYPRFKRGCGEYFFLPRRGEARGMGGIFFDDFAEGGAERGFALIRAAGEAFTPACLPILERRRAPPWGEREHPLCRRGRCVEFNLAWDRGTHFGPQSGGGSLFCCRCRRWRAGLTGAGLSRVRRRLNWGARFLVPRDWV